MPEITTSSGTEVEALTEIKDKDGNLLVFFNSKGAESFWGNEYQRERIRYCMRHRRDKISKSLRTGGNSLRLRLFGVESEANRLKRINQKEDSDGRTSNTNCTLISECE